MCVEMYVEMYKNIYSSLGFSTVNRIRKSVNS